MKKIKLLLSIAISIAFCISTYADDSDDDHTVTIDVPEVALVDIEGATSTSITLQFGAPASDEAGSPISNPSDNTSLWLNYSSIVGASGETRNITVKLDNAVSEGTLSVQAASDAGNGLGSVGTAAASAISLSTTATNIITSIGSCYTGNGTSNGHQLTYSLSVTSTSSNYGNLVHNTDNQYTVTYTITDES